MGDHSMSTARSGILLLVFFVAALLTERYLTQQRDIPFAWAHAVILALGVTLTIGSIQGIAEAWRQRRPSEANPTLWRDGEVVHVEGNLRLRDLAAHTPFSQRAAVYVDYGAWAPRRTAVVSVTQRAHWGGFVAMPAELEMRSGRIALFGMPPARHWSEEQFTGAEYHALAAHHLVATRWTEAPDVIALDLGAAIAAFSENGPNPNGPVQQHLMNSEAAEMLGVRGGAASAADVLQQRLAERAWTFTERVVRPDARVTVIGTYRSTPPRLEVGLSVRHPEQAVYLGAAAPRAEQLWRSALVFGLVLAALTVAAHVVVLGAGSEWYRALLASAR